MIQGWVWVSYENNENKNSSEWNIEAIVRCNKLVYTIGLSLAVK